LTFSSVFIYDYRSPIRQVIVAKACSSEWSQATYSEENDWSLRPSKAEQTKMQVSERVSRTVVRLARARTGLRTRYVVIVCGRISYVLIMCVEYANLH
jgi:hypothetical protein